MVEGGRPLHTRSEGLKVPKITESAESRRGTVGDRVAEGVDAELLNGPLGNPGRDEEGRNTATKTVEFIGVVEAIGCLLSIGKIIRTRSKWRRNMVVIPARLVKGEDKESVFPLRAGTERFIDLAEKRLAVRYQTAIVHRCSANTTAGRVEVGEGGQVSSQSIGVELRHRNDLAGFVVFLSPSVRVGFRASTTGSIPVVEISMASLAHRLKDVGIVELECIVRTKVGAVSMRATRCHCQTVWISGLYNLSAIPFKIAFWI